MKLYAWQPDGHGEKSFFVMAENIVEALEAVLDAIKGLDEYYSRGFGTDYYTLTVAGPGKVILNDND